MVVKSEIKFIKSLYQKKYRSLHGMFPAEGIRTVTELLQAGMAAYKIYATEPIQDLPDPSVVSFITEPELKKMSSLRNPNKVLGAFHIPKPDTLDFRDWILVLDEVKDPGNLGTIIRLCDWFGIRHLVCSPGTVDCYNPKVLQATMGSIARVNISYAELLSFLDDAPLPAYGTFLSGRSVYEGKLPAAGLLVMGNEARGISDEVAGLLHEKITIPRYSGSQAESLNVAMASAIFLNEIRRPGGVIQT